MFDVENSEQFVIQNSASRTTDTLSKFFYIALGLENECLTAL